MNLILFEPAEVGQPLPRTDARAQHLLQVLHRQEGDAFDAGLVDGPRGKGTLVHCAADHLDLAFSWSDPPPPLSPITLLLGLPRPQTARKILQEATALGVSSLHFVRTEKADPSYAQSPLWQTGEWRQHLLTGAAQAFCTRLPVVTAGRALAETLEALPQCPCRLALDNYEACLPLAESIGAATEVALALGPERGWGSRDRELLRAAGFTLVHLGARVLRQETATVAAIAIVKAQLRLF